MVELDGPASQALFREQLDTLLASREFASSRHLSEFLRFVSECAFQGRAQLEQNEIAAHVLGNSDFVATYDSSVRKLASMARQRLARYYEGEGGNDQVVVTLPLRSYLPVYQIREAAPAPPPPMRAETGPLRRRFLVPIALLILAAGAGLAWKLFPSKTIVQGWEYQIDTARGDLSGGGSDVAPGNLLVIKEGLEDGNEFTAQLLFRPESEAQQAGIILFKDGDNFVRLGRRFSGRNHLEFGSEWNGVNSTPPENVVFDPEGQTGRPIWLSIRRSGFDFKGFVSYDGLSWKPVGSPLRWNGGLDGLRAGIYAFHGRREAPSARAVFRDVSTGFSLDAAPLAANCPVEVQREESHTSLFLRIPSKRANCNALVSVAKIGGSEWAVESRIDFINNPGAMAGLIVMGKSGRLRLLRYDANGPAIVLMLDNKAMYSKSDFHGSPPVTFRLDQRGGWIGAGYSRDGETFETFEQRIRASDLGTGLSAGIMLATSQKSEAAFEPAMRIQSIRKEALPLRAYR